MSQQTINRRHNQQVNAPFRAKSAGVSLVVIIMIGMYYIANALPLLTSEEAVPAGALGLAITATVMIAVTEAALQIVLFIGAGQIEDRTKRDDVIATQASRNAYLILTVGTFVAVGSMFANFTPYQLTSLLLAAFLLAEVVRLGSQIIYYRQTS